MPLYASDAPPTLSVFNNEIQAELYSQLAPEDKELIKKADHWRATESGYNLLQSSESPLATDLLKRSLDTFRMMG